MLTRRRVQRSSNCCGRVWTKMSRVKKLEDPDEHATQLSRCLGTRDAVLLALGAMVGSGGYVLEGVVVKEEAGPVAIVCFLISGVVTMMAAFCFAEFGVLIPRAGSAYVYVYVTLGEFWAFLVGWSLLVSCMTATVPLSHTFFGYVDDLFDHGISNGTEQIIGTMDVFIFDRTPNIVAAVLCVIMIVIKTGGVHSSSKINSVFTIFNMSVLTFVIIFGLYLADFSNWDNFMPYGFSGFLKGCGTCFFAYPGFEDITFASEEIRNPGRAIPIAVCWCMTLAMLVYMLFAAAITLSVPLSALDAVSAAPSAFAYHGYYWPKYLVSAGAISGTVAAMYGIMYISSRVAYSMAQDGLVFKRLAYVNPKTLAPSTSIIFTGLISMLMSLLFRTTDMIKLTNAGCLMTYIIVSGSLIMLRYDPPTFLTRAQFAINNGGPHHHDSTKDTDCLWGDELANPPGPCGLCQGIQLLMRPFKRGTVILACLIIIILSTAGMGTLMRLRYDDLVNLHHGVLAIVVCSGLMIVLATLVICSYDQRALPSSFHVPGVPILPIIAIMCYVALLLTLDATAWMLFGATTTIGMVMYFGYGLWHGSDADIGERFERASLRGEGETRSISVCYD